MRAWGFQLQVFFLGHRARTHLAICARQNSVIQDRSIYEDAHIFARALHDMKMLNLRDYRAYRELYDLVIGTLPPDSIHMRRPSRSSSYRCVQLTSGQNDTSHLAFSTFSR
jgi:deoxyadenosine/deoxycytidine kinase